MKKSIFLFLIILLSIAGFISFKYNEEATKKQLVIEKIQNNKLSKEEIKDKSSKSVDNNQINEEKEIKTSIMETSYEEDSKQKVSQSKKNSSLNIQKNEQGTDIKNIFSSEEIKTEKNPIEQENLSKLDIEEKPKEEKKKPEIVRFYESITHGKKDFSSEESALKVGDMIAKLELNDVMDYNEKSPENQITPDINYFRVYPSVIDENGQTWYYLHFFCKSGDNKDNFYKEKYYQYIKEKYPNLF